MTTPCMESWGRSCASVDDVGSTAAVEYERFAIPKSSTFTTPSSRTMMFSGFTSRCTMPALCAAASPYAAPASHAIRSASGAGGPSMYSRSDFPLMSSIAMYGVPRSDCGSIISPTSWMVITFGCSSAATLRASRNNRAAPPVAEPEPAIGSG